MSVWHSSGAVELKVGRYGNHGRVWAWKPRFGSHWNRHSIWSHVTEWTQLGEERRWRREDIWGPSPKALHQNSDKARRPSKGDWVGVITNVGEKPGELGVQEAKKESASRRRQCWASLVVQWLRIRLPMQGTRVQSLVLEDPTCCGATKPVSHRYWACALGPVSHNYWARVLQLLKHTRLEPVLRNKRSHSNKKPTHCNEDPTQPKKIIK